MLLVSRGWHTLNEVKGVASCQQTTPFPLVRECHPLISNSSELGSQLCAFILSVFRFLHQLFYLRRLLSTPLTHHPMS